MSNNLYLQTLYRENKKKANLQRPPIWFMRQAGRCLADYRALRKKYSFRELMYRPELASEVTLQPIKKLKVDAAILFSDILVIAEALGQKLIFSEQSGPQLTPPLSTQPLTTELIPNQAILDPVYQTIRTIVKAKKEIPLIGFCGGPLTLFLYMWQGLSQNQNKIPQHKFAAGLEAIYQQRTRVEKILDNITELTIVYAQEQVKSGVQAFQIFESWAGIVPFNLYSELILPRVYRIAQAINRNVPVVFFPLNIGVGYLEILQKGHAYFSGIGVDWQTSLSSLQKYNPHNLVLQGNLNPFSLIVTEDHLQIENSAVQKAKQWQIVKNNLAKEYSERLKSYPNDDFYWIFNLGHGVLPNTDEEILKKVVAWVKQH